MTPRVREAWMLTTALCVGCGEPSDPSDTTGAGTDGADETRYAPVFTEPADRLLELDTNESVDTFLALKFVYVGFTSLLVDGESVGSLSVQGRIGLITPDMLQLNFHGAMVAGRHSMQLFTPGTTRELFSAPVKVQIAAGSTPVPAATFASEGPAGIASIEAYGQGEAGGVLAVEDADPPRVHLIPAREGQLDADAAVTVELPGYVVSQWSGGRPAVSVDAHGPTTRVAWTAGIPGDRVEVRDLHLDTGEVGAVVTALPLVPEITGPAEWAELGRPVLAEDTVLVELAAHLDVEQPVPGERVLAVVQLSDGPTPGKPLRLELAGPRDLDGLGPSTDMADVRLKRPALTYGIRVDGVRAAVLDVHPEDGSVRLLPSVLPDADLSFAGLAGDVRAIQGAFGSRTTFARDGEAFVVLLADDRSDNGVSRIEASFADTGLTGPAAFGVLSGAPVILLPLGEGADVQTLASDGASLDGDVLSGVTCRQVALVPDLRGNTEGALALACLREGTVHLGRLTAGGGG